MSIANGAGAMLPLPSTPQHIANGPLPPCTADTLQPILGCLEGHIRAAISSAISSPQMAVLRLFSGVSLPLAVGEERIFGRSDTGKKPETVSR